MLTLPPPQAPAGLSTARPRCGGSPCSPSTERGLSSGTLRGTMPGHSGGRRGLGPSRLEEMSLFAPRPTLFLLVTLGQVAGAPGRVRL